MTPHLFVYGTLLSSAGHPMGARLRREARLVGQASLPGRLVDLGRYPGLIEAGDMKSRVHGEVYVLNSPAASLPWLDAYEGIRGDSQDGAYERVERMVALASGRSLAAWVYLYRGSTRGRALVPGGRWALRRP
jgi:gamma-glutamylcyclotransferase (GGCT)/AIG2-like uncharacterized protein YtfP